MSHKKELGLAFMWLNHTVRSNASFVTATGPLARAFLLANFAAPARLNTQQYWRLCQITTLKFASLVLLVNAIGWFWKGLPDTIGTMITAWTILLWLRPCFIPHYFTSLICGLILWGINAVYIIYSYTHHSILPSDGAASLLPIWRYQKPAAPNAPMDKPKQLVVIRPKPITLPLVDYA